RLEVLDDPETVDEAQQPLRLSRGGGWRAMTDGRVARIAYRRRTGPGILEFDATRFHRSIATPPGTLRLTRVRSRFHVALEGTPITIEHGGRRTVALVWGCGETAAEADASLARAEAAIAAAGSPEAALERVKAEWRRFLAALPAPAGAPAAERRVLEVAATGLRMSELAARGRMPTRATYPSKVN